MTYCLGDSAEVRSKTILVAGGGKDLLEAAIELSTPPLGNTVTLSYRGLACARAIQANRQCIEDLVQDGRLAVLINSEVTSTEVIHVNIRVKHVMKRALAADAYILIGGVLPAELIERAKVGVDVKFGTA